MISFSFCDNSLDPNDYFMYPQFLTLRNTLFCLHSTFMCYVLISEQTAVIPFTDSFHNQDRRCLMCSTN